jgi:hypothetical protein
MPCYLFTYHAYGSWMPDRSRGYVKRGHGVLPPDAHMAKLYSRAMKETEVAFDDQLQRWAIASLIESEPLQKFDLYYIATDVTHLHALLAWRDEREPVRMRSLLKGSITRTLNRTRARRTWLSEGASRKQVKRRGHFQYLFETYLPKHSGWKWTREKGYFK